MPSTTLIRVAFLSLVASCALGLNVGMNLPGNTYYNNYPCYYDVFMQASANNGKWDVAGAPDAASLLDSTGAPIPTPIGGGKFSTEAWSGFTKDYSAGAYTLTWEGSGTISISTSDVLVTNVRRVYTAGKVQNSATVTLPGPNPNGGPTDGSWIQVIAHLPVTDIHLFSPKEFQIPNSVFRSDFIDVIRPFTTLRFMDSFYTNGNTVQNWSERTLPSAGSRGGTKQGMAYEDVVDLIKTTKKAAWINVPARATDNYVCRMARFFALGELGPTGNPDAPCDPKAAPTGPFTSVHLDSSDTVYLEYSNEVWNYGFQQTQDFLCMANLGQFGYNCAQFTGPTSAIAAAALANSSMGWISTTDNKWGRAQQLMFVLAKRVVDIFRQVFAISKSPPVLRTVLNVQFVYPGCYYYAYPFFEKNFGSFGDTFEYYAIAPYFDVDNDTYTGSLDAIFNDLDNNILSENPSSPDSNNILRVLSSQVIPTAKTLKVKGIVAYEGGQGLSGDTNSANKIAAQQDPRMYNCTRKYLQLWQKYVGDDSLFNYFSLAGSYSKYGSWGALYALTEHGSQKFDAVLSLIAKPGDANLDGQVNSLDCDILKLNYKNSLKKSAATQLWWRDADFNHDGLVNKLDLDIMNANSSPNMCVPKADVVIMQVN